MAFSPLMSGLPISKTTMLLAEMKMADASGLLGFDQLDWGAKGGKLWEFWLLSPCCGAPVTPFDAIYCCATFSFCGLCATSKMLANTLGQTWAVWPHCVCTFCCPLCTKSALRYNLRKQQGVSGTILGDCMCNWCCGPCAAAQELRSVEKARWDLLPFQAPEMSIPELQFIK